MVDEKAPNPVDLRLAGKAIRVRDRLAQGLCAVVGDELRNDRREHEGMVAATRCWERPDMADRKKSELAGKSDELLDALNRLKDTEQRKRREPISSDRFHELANEVDAISHEVFAIARTQERVGDQIPTSDESIDDVVDEEKGA